MMTADSMTQAILRFRQGGLLIIRVIMMMRTNLDFVQKENIIRRFMPHCNTGAKKMMYGGKVKKMESEV